MSTYVAVTALVLAYVALVAAYFALRTLAKLRRATMVIARGSRGPEGKASIVEITRHNTERAEILAEEIAELRALILEGGLGSDDPPSSLRHVALVRYDAFTEMSGRMSFSLALLDDKGDGVTISSIASAGDTRVYAKGVADGKGEHELTPEELQAVASALSKRRGFLHRRAS